MKRTEPMTNADKPVKGRGVHFQDGRKVDLFDLDGRYGLRFTQTDGEETKIALSAEAMMALVRLYIEAHEADSAFTRMR